MAELLFLVGAAVFGVGVGVVEEFDEGARFAGFDGEEGGFVAFEVDAGLYQVFVNGQGIFEDLALAALGCCPFAALFEGSDGVFIAVNGVFPVLEFKGKLAEVASCLETLKRKGRRSPNF